MKVFFKSDNDNFECVEFNDFYNDTNKNELFRIVNLDNNNNIENVSSLIQKAEDMNLDIFMVNEKVSPKIVKIIDMQKYIYELKKAKKENEKKQKALQEKNKEIRISLNISEHDLEIKVNHTKEFADKGSRVKFLLRLHGREGTGEAGKKYVHDFFEKVLTMFEGYNVGEVKVIGNVLWTEITKM